jgi:DNA-binding transcriptional MerR regulator
MLIQEFCRATGLGRDTVRFYVKRGLLTPAVGAAPRGATNAAAPSNRYQVFDAAQVERARLIRAAQALGFTLAEIAALAAAYERGALSTARKAEVLRAHLAALDARAAHLDTLRGYLGAKLRWVEAGERGTPPAFAPAAAGTEGPRVL